MLIDDNVIEEQRRNGNALFSGDERFRSLRIDALDFLVVGDVKDIGPGNDTLGIIEPRSGEWCCLASLPTTMMRPSPSCRARRSR